MTSFVKGTTLGLVMLGLATGCLVVGSRSPVTHTQGLGGGKKKDKKKMEAGKEAGNAADLAAIQKAARVFADAFESGDAKAMAASWTENGEYIGDDGTVLRGRETIEKEYTTLFAKRKGKVKVSIEVESMRFPSKDTAIEEGVFKVRSDKEPMTSSKYTVLHVREGGQWLMAVVREWPSAGDSVRDLEWLIGNWSSKGEDIEIKSKYEWWGNKNFIRATFTIKTKEKTVTGFQMIGKDASTGQIRSWAFDPDGSFGEAVWAREGEKWTQESAAVLNDGGTLAMTNIMTRLNADTFTFQSVERSLDGADLPDINPVRVSRVKSNE